LCIRLAWLLGNVLGLITADRWRGMGSGAGFEDEPPWVGEVRTDNVLPVFRETRSEGSKLITMGTLEFLDEEVLGELEDMTDAAAVEL